MIENTNQSEKSSAELTTSISKEIGETSLDLTIDYAELTLDSFFSDELVKEIPIVKTLFAIGKIGISINERFFIKKLLTFLKQLHADNISPVEREKFKNKFESDHKYRDKVTEHIIVYVNSFLDVEKAKILARLFSSYISGNFEWEYFLQLSACLNNLNLGSLQLLKKLSDKDFQTEEGDQKRDYNSEALLSAGGIGYTASAWSSSYYVSDAGKDLYKFGINED